MLPLPKTNFLPMIGAHIVRFTQPLTHPIFRKRTQLFHILSDEFLIHSHPVFLRKIDGKN
jgi:hypothetical protein